jgi:hypothetical protein
MSKQIPHGDADRYCPLWRKPMSKVCHTCPWWICVSGANPQTGERIDRWECAIAMMPILQVETAKEVRQGAAATESFRNEVVRRADGVRPAPSLAVGGPSVGLIGQE